MNRSVAIVGGGIIGITSAWYLRKSGWRVTVIDRGSIGGACSHGNCGLICPSHVLPLTEPGAMREAVKALVRRNSPFRIKPRLDPALWSWLWRFFRRCNHESMIQSGHAIQSLLASSMSEYKKLVQDESLECEWQENGLLFVYRSEKALDAYSSTNQLLTEVFSEPAQKLAASETVQLESSLRDDVAGAWFYPEDAHIRPDRLIQSMRSRLEDDGVDFVQQCEFQLLEGANGIATGISTSAGKFTADKFLFAAGAWSPKLQSQLGCRILVEPGKGYSITMPRPEICPSIPIIFPEHRVAVTPMKSGYRIGSIMEFAGWDESMRAERLELLRQGASHYLKQPLCKPEVEQWYGWRPMTCDSVPIIDRCPKWQNVWLATGHNMLGLSMAPGTGKLISELIESQSPHVDPTPYRLGRF